MATDRTANAPLTRQPAAAQDTTAAPAGPVTSRAASAGELAMHELGEAIIASAVSIQRELRRYAESNGAFLLDDLELELPLKLRVDGLGQVLAEVVNDVPANVALARMRLRIRPDTRPVEQVPIVADQPLGVLKALSKDQLAFLESHRIFSVEDLIRAARNPARRKGLNAAIPEAVLERALGAGEVLIVPVLPPRVGEGLLRAGVRSVTDFLARDPAALGPALAKAMGEPIGGDQVARWQEALRGLRDPAPRTAPAAEVPAPARPPPRPDLPRVPAVPIREEVP